MKIEDILAIPENSADGLLPAFQQFDHFVDWANIENQSYIAPFNASTSFNICPNNPPPAGSTFSNREAREHSFFNSSKGLMPLSPNVISTNKSPELLNSFHFMQKCSPPSQASNAQNIDFTEGHTMPVANMIATSDVVVVENVSLVDANQRVQVELVNAHLWRKLSLLTNEMKVSMRGNRLYPKLAFNVTGLEADQKYQFHLVFHRQGNCRYKFYHNLWIPNRPAIPEHENIPISHPLNDCHPQGTKWINQEVTFDVKITSSTRFHSNNTVLRTFHKYIPMLTISRFDFATQAYLPFVDVFIPIAEFIAVSAYYNRQVAEIKIDTHPRTSWLRESRKRCRIDNEMAPYGLLNENFAPYPSLFNFLNTPIAPSYTLFNTSNSGVTVPLIDNGNVPVVNPEKLQSFYDSQKSSINAGFGGSAPVFHPKE